MPRLRNNILANYAGQVWIAVMGVAFVPLYIHLLGAENFGLVGFMLSLQAISLLLDFGVGIFLGRELARRAHDPIQRGRIRQLIRTFEWLVWPTAAIIAIAIWRGSSLIASHWLHSQHVSHADMVSALTVMGLAIALLWPSSFYASALSGLEQQPRLNVIAAIFAALRYAGVVPVLYLTDTGLQGFLWWHVAVAAAQTACTALVLWWLMPAATEQPRFHAAELADARHFALGIFAITATSLALTQIDRLTLSALRPLSELGYYTVAVTVSGGLGRMVQPMFNAIYPRMSRLIASNDHLTLVALYHLASQCLAVVAAAIACVLGFYAQDVLWLWTGDASLATKVATPMAILVAGTALNGLMNVPYALQLANGWTRLPFASNVVALVLGIPFCIVAVQHLGMVGAACLWLAINLGYVVLVIPLIHRRLLQGEIGHWYLQDVLPPVLAALAVTLLAKWAHPSLQRDLGGLAWLAGIGLTVLIAAALASTGVRNLLWNLIQRRHARTN
jgi:O-antigen/teichoic acid export membrane protein